MPKKGYKQTEEHKEKNRQSNRGKKRSLEYRQMMKERLLKDNPAKREDVREKMKKNHWSLRMFSKNKGKKLWGIDGIIGKPHPNKGVFGKKHSEEHKRKIGESGRGKRIGEKNPMWEGGVSKINDLIRKMPEYKDWRTKVFERDDYTCQECGQRGCYLEAHHLKQFKTLLEINSIKNIIDARNCDVLWEIENGQTLCQPCHGKTKIGRGK